MPLLLPLEKAVRGGDQRGGRAHPPLHVLHELRAPQQVPAPAVQAHPRLQHERVREARRPQDPRQLR